MIYDSICEMSQWEACRGRAHGFVHKTVKNGQSLNLEGSQCKKFKSYRIYISHTQSRGLAERGQEEEQENERH